MGKQVEAEDESGDECCGKVIVGRRLSGEQLLPEGHSVHSPV